MHQTFSFTKLFVTLRLPLGVASERKLNFFCRKIFCVVYYDIEICPMHRSVNEVDPPLNLSDPLPCLNPQTVK